MKFEKERNKGYMFRILNIFADRAYPNLYWHIHLLKNRYLSTKYIITPTAIDIGMAFGINGATVAVNIKSLYP